MVINKLEHRLAQIQGGRVLDAATGSGQFVQVLTESLGSFNQITGVDSSEKAIAAAKERFPDERYSFERQDCQATTFTDSSFDTVALSNSLHHFSDPRKVLAELQRICRPGGHLIISEMVCDGQSEPQMTHVLLHHWWAAIDTLTGIVHRPTYSREQIQELLTSQELEDAEFFEWDEDDSDPKDPERLLQFHGIADDYLAKIPECDKAEQLRATGRELHERLDSVGILGATTLIAIARK